MRKILIGSLCLMILTLGGCQLSKNKQESVTGPKGCTMEAKICPDGSAVGRSGSNCEFTPCPEGEKTGIANPAATYCEANGGRSSIVTNADGSQGGNCLLPGGKVCEEWAYFRGECQ